MKKTKIMTMGIISGALGLTILCSMINLLLTVRKYVLEIDNKVTLLYKIQRFCVCLMGGIIIT